MGVMGWLLGAGCEELAPADVRAMKESSEGFVLLDVRTPAEFATRNIEGAKLIPLRELDVRAGEIPRDRDVVVYCQNGIRSLMACRHLKKLGFSRVKNMTGGISRW